MFFCARYEVNMMTAAQKTIFENLFKQKKFHEIPNALYRGWLGFKIAAVSNMEEDEEKKKEKEVQKKEKEEQIEQKKRQREQKKTLATAEKKVAAAKIAEKAAKKAAEEEKKAGKAEKNQLHIYDPKPGPSKTRKSSRTKT